MAEKMEASLGSPPMDMLTPFERLAFRTTHWLYKHAPGLQDFWLRRISANWITMASFPMVRPLAL